MEVLESTMVFSMQLPNANDTLSFYPYIDGVVSCTIPLRFNWTYSAV